MNKQEIIDSVLGREGGYSNDSDDSGGETNFGVTIQTARHFGYKGDMKDLTREQAVEIYEKKYWNEILGDDLLAMSESVASEVMDTSVNMGTGRAVQFLQRALNCFMIDPVHTLKVDGVMGVRTLTQLAAYLTDRRDIELVKALNCLQGAWYLELCERRVKDKKFLYGWFTHRVHI